MTVHAWPVFQRRISFPVSSQASGLRSSSTPSSCSARLPLALRLSPAPTSLSAGACSYTSTSKPRLSKARAAVRPPIPAPAIRTRGLAFSTLFRPRARVLDHLRPPRQVVAHDERELLGRAADRLHAQIGELRAHFRERDGPRGLRV